MNTWIIIILAILVFVTIISIDYYLTKKTWNNGKCKCGGNWVHTYALDDYHYIYQCDKCKKEIMMNKFLEE